MPNSKLRCKWCKEYKKAKYFIAVPSGKFCSLGCVHLFIDEKRDKARLKAIAKSYGSGGGRKKGKVKKDYDNDRKTRKEAAKTACHTYIRARDYGNPCICCGEPTGSDSQAGHWIPSGQNPQVRYDEDNIHLQNLNCNYFKGGDSGNYKYNLIKKIGVKRTEALESKQGGTMKRTCEDFKKIEDYYKAKLKALRQ